MTNDPIIEEIRAVRQRISESCGHDLHRIALDAQAATRQSGLKRATLKALELHNPDDATVSTVKHAVSHGT